MNWDAFDKFCDIVHAHMPSRGEGETLASQAVTAVNKLVYKWYNDGDVYDNTYYMSGWCNDLSSYANWLYKNVPETKECLDRIEDIDSDEEYEKMLYDLCEIVLTTEWTDAHLTEKVGSIYDAEGKFEFVEQDGEDDTYDDWY